MLFMQCRFWSTVLGRLAAGEDGHRRDRPAACSGSSGWPALAQPPGPSCTLGVLGNCSLEIFVTPRPKPIQTGVRVTIVLKSTDVFV